MWSASFPSGQVKRVQHPRSVEGLREQAEIRLGEFLPPLVQAHDDKEITIEKKRTPEFRHRDRMGHGGDDSYGKDADCKIGGPHYLLYRTAYRKRGTDFDFRFELLAFRSFVR